MPLKLRSTGLGAGIDKDRQLDGRSAESMSREGA